MSPDELSVAIKDRQKSMQMAIFTNPPQDMNELAKRLGIWTGLNDALSIIEDARKREMKDD